MLVRVWQHTGEEWKGVQLALSTERPSLGESPPELADDWLTLREIGTRIAVEARESDVQTTGAGASKNVLRELPGIDDGGEARFLRPEGRYEVPSDGRMAYVPIATFRTPARVDRIILGELVPAVLSVTEIHNQESQPILPGSASAGAPIVRCASRARRKRRSSTERFSDGAARARPWSSGSRTSDPTPRV